MAADNFTACTPKVLGRSPPTATDRVENGGRGGKACGGGDDERNWEQHQSRDESGSRSRSLAATVGVRNKTVVQEKIRASERIRRVAQHQEAA
jgi:hypothetical protein